MDGKMISIDQEVEHLEKFLSHSCGFEVSIYDILEIRPIDEGCPPSNWEVSWKGMEDGMEIDSYKEFNSLHDACQFFVEKRRYMCLGADFEEIMMGSLTISVEIEKD